MEDNNNSEHADLSENSELFPVEEKKENSKSLSRSAKNKVLFGVCGGIADYFKIHAAIIRILFSILIFIGGWGIIAYLIAAFLMPADNKIERLSENDEAFQLNNETRIILSILLIVIGVYEILNAYHFWMVVSLLGFSAEYYIPVLIFASGIAIIIKSFKMHAQPFNLEEKKLYRSSADSNIAGVAGGLAEYFNVSSVFMRTVFLLLLFLTGGIFVFVYLVMILTVPKEGTID